MKTRARLLVLLAAMACGGSDSPTGGASADRVVVSPGSFTLTRSQTRQLEAVAYASDGRLIEGARPTWSSDAPDVATVNADGVVTAVTPGATRIVARIAGQEGSALVSVLEGQTGATIDVLSSVTYQTMSGWEATAQAGELECNQQAFGVYKDQLFDRAANEMGIDRLRLELRSGDENPVDWFARYQRGEISVAEWRSHRYDIVNDNGDPNSQNAAGFQFSYLDYKVDRVVTPMRQRLAARGEKLYVTLTYVDFATSSFEHSSNPAEYAEFVLAAFRHLQQKYGWAPDAVEMVLEPDVTPNWNAQALGRALVATGDRLASAGFRPDFIAPSSTNMSTAVASFDAMLAVPRVREYLTDLAYHRYAGVNASTLQGIGQRAVQYGVRTGMLEHIGSGIDDLIDDLVTGRASAWQQFTIAFCAGADDGAQYYLVNQASPASPQLTVTREARYLRHVFMFVRRGAQRIGAVSGDARLVPVAFRNANGNQVVVVRAKGAGPFSVRGLAAGRYGISTSTSSSLWVEGTDQTIAAGGVVNVSIPSDGVVTIFRR